MTENEAIERIKSGICNEIGTAKYCHDNCMYGVEHCAYSMAINALEEIQAYRAIGTVEEFKALKENSVAKKIIAKKKTKSYLGTDYYCPTCDERQLTAYAISKGDDYCKDCGQKLDWE